MIFLSCSFCFVLFCFLKSNFFSRFRTYNFGLICYNLKIASCKALKSYRFSFSYSTKQQPKFKKSVWIRLKNAKSLGHLTRNNPSIMYLAKFSGMNTLQNFKSNFFKCKASFNVQC